MITENGLTADLACVTACRPAGVGHYNNSVNPLLFTIHDIEDNRADVSDSDTDLMIGAAGSDDGIMGDSWLDKPDTEASVHFGVYPGGVAQCLPLNRGCWGAGPSANAVAIQAEQSGMASYGLAQWLTPDGVRQLNNITELYAELCVFFGWSPHWATDAEIQACVAGDTASNGFGGATYHHDWTRNFPNDTTHTDPGTNYPGKADGPYIAGQQDPDDHFMPLAVAKWRILTGRASITPTPTPPTEEDMPLDPIKDQAAFTAMMNNWIANYHVGVAWNAADKTPPLSIPDLLGQVSRETTSNWQRMSALVASFNTLSPVVNFIKAKVAGR